MEPIEKLKKYPKQLSRLAALRKRIYTPAAELYAELFRSPEPVLPESAAGLEYMPVSKNERWAGIFDCAWFRFTGVVPDSAKGRHVAAHIDIGGEGQLYDGLEPVAAITSDSSYIDKVSSCIAKSIIEISQSAQGGEKIEYYIDAGYNGYYNLFIGSGKFRYAEICTVDDALRDYYYDYLTIASLATADSDREKELLALLEKSYKALDISVARAREILAPILSGKPDETLEFTAVGHSHLDLAWLWPMRETKRKAKRTFAHQLCNADRYPEYIYGASQPQQFEWVKNSCPEQYKKLQKMAERGQLEPQGGMWVEADTNITSGEALIRQLHYGSEFFKNEFGKQMEICWLPDVFGYNGNLPQLLRICNIPYFCTIKLSWNEHNRFPHRSFVWKGIDGSEVLVHMPPAETYNSAGSPACAIFARDNYPEKAEAGKALMLYGIGDGGGGPGEAHIEMIKRQASLEGSPKIKFGRAVEFFHELDEKRGVLPEYSGELYLEKHQGTYTTQGANKNYNRRCEYALADAEALLALAGECPQQELDALWKETLLYQFHDIIPGSSIGRVYAESCAGYAIILRKALALQQRALEALGETKGNFVFNPSGFERRELICENGECLSAAVSPWGFAELEPFDGGELSCDENTLENEKLRVRFGKGGEIVSLTTKADGFEYAHGELNVLRLYADKPLMYNAWDIDWKYMNKPSLRLRARSVRTEKRAGEVVRICEYKHYGTRITQEISLRSGDDALCFKTHCDWHECFVMLRADFSTAIFSDTVKCDIQMGSIERSAHDATPQEKAQFEICAHKYIDFTKDGHGLSLLNNCKYGHRAKDGFMSLNLLRSPIYPDPKADRHEHDFSYALLPHAGECGTQTLKRSYFLNKPLIRCEKAPLRRCIAKTDNEAVVVETIKPAWNGSGVVLRLYESLGAAALCNIETAFGAETAAVCDAMENPIGEISLKNVEFKPFEIKTLKISIS